ncbi:GMC family oxidoreductase, partial [Parasphingorhabdus sp.]
LQFPVNPDFNADSQEGIGYYQVTQRDGRRWSSAQAFLRQVEGRANLHIITDARAERVLMNGKSTVGVAFRQGRESKKLKLKPGGEVLLSGGTVNSPQLLMLSGIGDRAVLRHNGIPIVHDLPEVGQNMADHLDVTIMNAANSRKPIGVAASFIPRALGGLWSYIFSRRGFLTSNVAEAGGFVQSSPDRDRPNVQFHFLPTYLKDHGRKLAFGYGYTLHICDLLPKSRGYISLKSSDPMADPLIQPGYLADPDDLKTIIAAFKIGRRILDAPAMAAHSAAEVHPGPSVQTDDEIAAFIRDTAETIYHPTGTCRMGADAESVVDASLRVRGISGLRVVDASIMPSLVAGNTNAPTMMIAENAADMILGKVGTLDANAA